MINFDLYDKLKTFTTNSTIRNKIIFASIAIVIIPLLILSITVGEILSSRTEEIFLERMNAELRHIDSFITIFLKNAVMDIEMLCADPAFQEIGPSTLHRVYDKKTPTDLGEFEFYGTELKLYNTMKRVAATHSDYVQIYAGSRYGGSITDKRLVVPAGFDPRARPWYNDGVAAGGKAIITKSYFSVTGEPVTAVVKALLDSNNKVFAVAGIDISLKYLTGIIRNIRIGKTGYLVLMEKDGTILTHPAKAELISRNIKDTGIPEFEQFFHYRDSIIHYTFDGKRKIASLYNSPAFGWKLMAVIEMDEVNAAGFYFRCVIWIVAAIIFLSCIFLYIYTHRNIIIPLKDLTDFGHSIAAGNFETPLEIQRDDELGRLANDFNEMMHRLKESADSIKAIIEMMPSVIIQLDTSGRVVEWNRQAQKFTGISLNEARNRQLYEIKPEISAYLNNLRDIIESGKPVSFYRIKISGFEKNYFNLFIFLLKTEHSPSLVLRIDDITEFEKKDEQIRHIQKMESIGLLASGIAHDFNNILGGMLATVSLLNYRIKKGKILNVEDTCKELDLVEKSCQTGAAIASQLLNL